jgi:hypothetical protein
MDETCSKKEEDRNADKILVGKHERKSPLGRRRRRRKDNIRINLRKAVWDSYDIGLGPVAGSWEHGNEPSIYIKDGQFLD